MECSQNDYIPSKAGRFLYGLHLARGMNVHASVIDATLKREHAKGKVLARVLMDANDDPKALVWHDGSKSDFVSATLPQWEVAAAAIGSSWENIKDEEVIE